MRPRSPIQPERAMQCGARTRTGEPCRAYVVKGRTRCRMHGGRTPRGHALPQTRHGRYSRDLPTQLALRVQEAAQDPELLELRDEIALVDARISQLLERLDSGEAGTLWKRQRQALRRYRRAEARRERARQMQLIEEIFALIEAGAEDNEAWGEIGSMMDRRIRLVESERRRLVEMKQMVPTEKVVLFVAAVADAIRRHVKDHATRAALTDELAALLGTRER
ncbi:MAG TPA: HGGxSTG domain-containing protein [Longimicrobiaceae bacterium]|nr:HGGxSTG domain-containing protein [Longimicrobiaceae bacterium]